MACHSTLTVALEVVSRRISLVTRNAKVVWATCQPQQQQEFETAVTTTSSNKQQHTQQHTQQHKQRTSVVSTYEGGNSKHIKKNIIYSWTYGIWYIKISVYYNSFINRISFRASSLQ